MHCLLHPLAEAVLLWHLHSRPGLATPAHSIRKRKQGSSMTPLRLHGFRQAPQQAAHEEVLQAALLQQLPSQQSLTSISSRTAFSAERMAADATSSAELAELSAAWARSSSASHCRRHTKTGVADSRQVSLPEAAKAGGKEHTRDGAVQTGSRCADTQ